VYEVSEPRLSNPATFLAIWSAGLSGDEDTHRTGEVLRFDSWF
jgi:hypothetical protein